MKKSLVSLLYKTLPNPLYRKLKNTWRFLRYEQFRHLLVLQKKYVATHGLVVSGGPFEGLLYVPDAIGSILLPKLIGSYEYILHETVTNIVGGIKPEKIIDIGVAEGYYLIGLGKNLPGTSLVGYDIDTRALDLTRKLYKKNGLSNQLTLHNETTPESLEGELAPNTLLICDAEGFEKEILDPTLVPALKTTPYLLIETHDCKIAGVTEVLKERFRATHSITEIPFSLVPQNEFDFLQDLSAAEYEAIAHERGDLEQKWLWMELLNN